VFYELQMLRYSKQWLEKGQTQFVWNAMFAAFNVSARNLYDFLGKREKGNMNVADYRAYCRTFKRSKPDPVNTTLRDLNAQCLHLGNKRTTEADKKINIDRVRKMSAWVVSNMDKLQKSFNDEFRSKLKPEWTGLVAQEPIAALVWAGPAPSASAVTSILATGPTSVGEMITFDTTPKK
jgi:hypothetical protein